FHAPPAARNERPRRRGEGPGGEGCPGRLARVAQRRLADHRCRVLGALQLLRNDRHPRVVSHRRSNAWRLWLAGWEGAVTTRALPRLDVCAAGVRWLHRRPRRGSTACRDDRCNSHARGSVAHGIADLYPVAAGPVAQRAVARRATSVERATRVP